MADIEISSKIKLAVKDPDRENTIVNVRGIEVGGRKVTVIAGPCSVETREQVLEAAIAVKAAGASMLRGGAFKPRTRPYGFQGLGEEGLKILAEARDETGLSVVTEVMEPDKVELVEAYADVLQVGARNAQNYPLLKRLGKARKPVLLKRGLSSTIEEWLSAAEYILHGGNPDVILCERGLRTHGTLTRFTMDLSAIAIIKQVSHLPVIADPSHGTGIRSLVSPMSKASVAAGADGIIVEVHPNPEEALCDGPQSLRPLEFMTLMGELKSVASSVGREL